MDTPTLAAIALGLAMDAFAVSLGLGLCSRDGPARCAFRVGIHFGVFQAGMTLAGWLVGWATSGWVAAAGRWLAAGILWAVGARMLVVAWRKRATPCPAPGPAADPSRGWHLVVLSVATSIDALGAGAGLAYLGSEVCLAAAVIGATAVALPAAGVFMASSLVGRAGERASRAAETLGALVLLGIGVRILVAGG